MGLDRIYGCAILELLVLKQVGGISNMEFAGDHNGSYHSGSIFCPSLGDLGRKERVYETLAVRQFRSYGGDDQQGEHPVQRHGDHGGGQPGPGRNRLPGLTTARARTAPLP